MTKLRKDWSLSYFLYYICVLSYWGAIIQMFSRLIISQSYGLDLKLFFGEPVELSFLIKAIDNIIVFSVYFFLSKILKPIAEGNPFALKTPSYISYIAWSLLFLGAGKALIASIAFLIANPASESLIPLLFQGFNGWFIFGSFLLFVLSYVFKEGVRIYEEQKLTV